MDSMGTSRIETAIQRISESVFVGLCNIAGTSQMVAMRRDMMEINDILNCKPTDSRGYTLMLSGSKKEGFRLKGSDIDIMMWPNNHRVISKLSQFQYYNINRQTLILSDCSNSPPGFTLLYLINPSTHGLIRKACVKMNERQCVSSSKYRQVWCSISPGFTQHGPCIYQEDSDFDQAISLYSDFWPPSASSWIDRCHSWPQPHVVDDIVKNGCHFVAIGHKLGRHEDHEWRISFSLAEQKLVYAMNHSQALTFILLKLFIKEIINNEIADDDKLLCSYHMKTAVFWVIQQNIIPHWCPQNLLEGFWVCFKLLLKWVYEGVCPNFFIQENNMFLTKIYGEAQNQLFMRLFGLYEKGLASLLHSPSISPFIINVLLNPRLSICTNEHTLISETMFDLKVFEELYGKNIPFIQNLQRSFMYLHKIEYMINLPLLTQSQVPVIQKHTVALLQQTAFVLQMETDTQRNKVRYRTDKISCHMLKLASKFGCITDMLFIVMYYYKTLRYVEALNIIANIKIKLKQPYVMNRFIVDEEKYTEALGGQSLSTKMRRAVATDILYGYTTPYIQELILEQETSSEKIVALYIPSLVMLYMLEILCYRHVDTMAAQRALDDLQTLVHSDPGLLIDPSLRDISWQILGICQHVTGHYQDSLDSFEESLAQKNENEIHTATEVRIDTWNSPDFF